MRRHVGLITRGLRAATYALATCLVPGCGGAVEQDPTPVDPARLLVAMRQARADLDAGRAVEHHRIHALLLDVGDVLQDRTQFELSQQQIQQFGDWIPVGLQLAPPEPDSAFTYFVLGAARFRLFDMRLTEALVLLDRIDAAARASPDYKFHYLLTRAMVESASGHFGKALGLVQQGRTIDQLDVVSDAELLVVRAGARIALGLADVAASDVDLVAMVVRTLAAPEPTLFADALLLQMELAVATGRPERILELARTAGSGKQSRETKSIIAVYTAIATRTTDPALAFEQMKAALDDPDLHGDYRIAVAAQLAELAHDLGKDETVVRKYIDWFGRPIAAAVTLESELGIESGISGAQLLEQVDRQQAALDAMFEAWRTVPSLPSGTGFLTFGERCRRLRALMRLHMSAEPGEAGVVRAFEDLLRAQEMSTLARAFDVHDTTLERVRERYLVEDSGLLVYLPTSRGTDLFVVDRRNIEVHELEPSTDLRQDIEDLDNALQGGFEFPDPADAQRKTARLEDLARSLGTRLIPQCVEDRLRSWKHVTVVGAGLLWNLPAEALVLGDGVLLGEAIAVDSLGSVPVGVHFAERLAAPARRAVSLAATLVPRNPDVSPPPVAEFGRHDAEVLLGDTEPFAARLGTSCTVAALQSLLAESPGMVYVIAHGATPKPGTTVGLALEGGTFLPSHLNGCRVSGVVFVSSCSAGRGSRRAGDDDSIDTLCGAFLRAGATAVIASRCDVMFGSQQQLTAAFHREYMRGDSPAEALRVARRTAAAGSRLKSFENARVQLLGFGGMTPR